MYKKILLAVDRDGLASGAVPVLAEIAARSGAEVVAIHVRDAENETRGREEAADLLASVVTELRARGVSTVGEIRSSAHGHPARAIADAVRECRADLVAIGSHGRGDLSGIVLGSVGHEVASLLDVPILVVRPPGGGAEHEADHRYRISRVLVAASLEEPAALSSAAGAIALEHRARVRVVHVKQSVAVGDGAAYIEPEAEAKQAVARVAARLTEMGLDPQTEIVGGFGSIAREIVAAADRWDADLIVLGSRRPSELGGLLLGSIGHEVVHLTRRPVLLADRVKTASGAVKEASR